MPLDFTFRIHLMTRNFSLLIGMKNSDVIIWLRSSEGSYLPSNRNSPKSERIENAPLAILISTQQF